MDKRRREMLKAIREAASETTLFKGTSLTFGLRCIRTFETVNGIQFDPFNRRHRSLVHGMGVHEELLWTVKKINKAYLARRLKV